MMRRRKVATAVIAAAAIAAAGGGLAYATSGRGSPSRPQAHTVASSTPLIKKPVRAFPAPGTPSWFILESGPNARSFLIEVDDIWSSAGCPVGAQGTAVETATTIRVRAVELYAKGGTCAADDRPFLVRVPLHYPLDGRMIEGAGLKWPTSDVFYLRWLTHSGVVANRVPRVIGFAPGQAIRLLRGQELHGEIVNSRGAAVVAQSPARGRIPSDGDPAHQFGGTVKLTVGG